MNCQVLSAAQDVFRAEVSSVGTPLHFGDASTIRPVFADVDSAYPREYRVPLYWHDTVVARVRVWLHADGRCVADPVIPQN
jgi:hypothetical protein